MSCFGRKTRKCKTLVIPTQNIEEKSSNSRRKRRKRETAELKANWAKIKKVTEILKKKKLNKILTSPGKKTLKKYYTMDRTTRTAIQQKKKLQKTAKTRKDKLTRQRSQERRKTRKTRKRRRRRSKNRMSPISENPDELFGGKRKTKKRRTHR